MQVDSVSPRGRLFERTVEQFVIFPVPQMEEEVAGQPILPERRQRPDSGATNLPIRSFRMSLEKVVKGVRLVH